MGIQGRESKDQAAVAGSSRRQQSQAAVAGGSRRQQSNAGPLDRVVSPVKAKLRFQSYVQ